MGLSAAVLGVVLLVYLVGALPYILGGRTVRATVLAREAVSDGEGTSYTLTYQFPVAEETDAVRVNRSSVDGWTYVRTAEGAHVAITYVAGFPGTAVVGPRPLSPEDRSSVPLALAVFTGGLLTAWFCKALGRREDERLRGEGVWIVGRVFSSATYTQDDGEGGTTEYLDVSYTFCTPRGVISRDLLRWPLNEAGIVVGASDGPCPPPGTAIVVRYLHENYFRLL